MRALPSGAKDPVHMVCGLLSRLVVLFCCYKHHLVIMSIYVLFMRFEKKNNG